VRGDLSFGRIDSEGSIVSSGAPGSVLIAETDDLNILSEPDAGGDALSLALAADAGAAGQSLVGRASAFSDSLGDIDLLSGRAPVTRLVTTMSVRPSRSWKTYGSQGGVAGAPPMPIPSAVLLGLVGLGLVAGLRRERRS